VLKAPTLLYRANLGWILGRRFLGVTHRGRKSGRERHTVVEVVAYNEAIPEATVLAAWGVKNHWYRNLRAEAALEVRIGRSRWRSPKQRFLSPEQIVSVLDDFQREHPITARELSRVLGVPKDAHDPRREERIRALRAVAFAPRRAV
jgi:deazaflavin-dependent oxidoreductase (nitroreductase family)